jgi:hypothetical protein
MTMRLTAPMAKALRVMKRHEKEGAIRWSPHNRSRAALQRRGLVGRDDLLTDEGHAIARLLGDEPTDQWGRVIFEDASCSICGREVPSGRIAWDTYDWASDTGPTVACIDCATERTGA